MNKKQKKTKTKPAYTQSGRRYLEHIAKKGLYDKSLQTNKKI